MLHCRLDEAAEERLGPGFAHSGGHLASWQLGQEPIELSAPGGWTASAVEQVRDFVGSHGLLQ